MKGRYVNDGSPCALLKFNTYALAEVDTGDDSVFFRDVEVWIESLQHWVRFDEALSQRLVIPDNFNIHFRESRSQEERVRGWYY